MINILNPPILATTLTAGGALQAGYHTPVDASGGPLTVTLPTPIEPTLLSVEKIDSSTNAITISGNIRGSASSVTLNAQYEVRTFLWTSANTWRVYSDHRTKASLDATYAPISGGSGGGRQNNWTATTDPTATSDTTLGYQSGSFWLNTTTNTEFRAVSVATGAAVWRLMNPDVQVFTSSGTWTMPNWATRVEVYAIGGGCGGGSGARAASGTTSSGGAGGAGAGVSSGVFLPATISPSQTVTVGGGGAGGAAITTDSTAGAAGAAGNSSFFGTLLRAATNSGGGGGLINGSSSASSTVVSGNAGTAGPGASGTNGAAGSAANGVTGAPGGGSGGGITATPAFTKGGTGGSPVANSASTNIGTGGQTDGAAGTVGNTPSVGSAIPGGGGGGGASSVLGAGGAGGAGGSYGAGGGGGGSSLNGNASGAGGPGAGGIVVVITT